MTKEMSIEAFMDYLSMTVVHHHGYIFENREDIMDTLITKCHVDEEFVRSEISNIILSCYDKDNEFVMIGLLKKQYN